MVVLHQCRSQKTSLLCSLFILSVSSSDCFCSGVSSQCQPSTSHYWSTLRLTARDSLSEWSVTSRDGSTVEDDIVLVYDDSSMELTYQHQPGSEKSVHYWSLPRQFLGNKLTAYAGNLTVFHRFIFSGASVQDSELIMKARVYYIFLTVTTSDS